MNQAISSSHAPIRLGLKPEGAFACLIPWLMASLVEGYPQLSWWIAWVGSWFILALVFSGRVFALPRDRPLLDQVLRPWFLMHLVFASYNFLTAVFYWLDINGITLGLGIPMSSSQSVDLDLAAKVQRLYVLAHAGLVIGIGLVRQTPRRWRVQSSQTVYTRLLVGVAVASAVLTLALSFVHALGQFEVKMQGLFTVASAVSLGVAFRERSELRFIVIPVNIVLFTFALVSGWKGGPIVMVILVAAAFYPKAPRTTILASLVIFAVGATVLPSISNSIRSTAWEGEMTRWHALGYAVVELKDKEQSEIKQDLWNFLSGRLTEAGLFVKYVEEVPQAYPYYEFDIVNQAVASIVPRALWEDKRNLEELVSERVYRHSIVEPGAIVSAKPQYVVDGYLSYGAAGVFLALLIFGATAQFASNLCNSWLGGYLLGGVAFNGLFAIFWQGNAFEFVANSVVWSFVLVVVLSWLGISRGILRR